MLTLQFIPYQDIEPLNSDERINKLLRIVKGKSIVLMQGRLKPAEETMLIQKTMKEISKEFKGIEICTVYPEDRNVQFFSRIKKELARFLIGQRDGLTIVGPASIVKEIKKDPNRIQLFTIDSSDKKKKVKR